MKRALFIFLLSFTSLLLQAQNLADIIVGQRDTIESKILNEKRGLWIHLPYSYSASKEYPVVYLLDGDWNFEITYTIIERLSMLSEPICPEMIIVGIPNTDRTRDLTPYKPFPLDSIMPQQMVEASGGGGKFISFIENELMPYIESQYTTSPYQTLIGHSLGGLTVLNTLLHHTELFDAYIAIDPTANWVEGRLLEEFKNFNSKNTEAKVSLYIGMGSLNIGQDVDQIKASTSYWAEDLKSLFILDEYLTHTEFKNLIYGSKFYKDESHSSVPLVATYDAIRFLFDFYRSDIIIDDWENPDVNLANKIRRIYARRTEGLGYDIKPEEYYINDLAKLSLSSKHFNKAHQLLELNVSLYPDSPNVYNALGDYHVLSKENQKAIKNFKKALSISDQESIRIKLKKLLKN